MSEVLIPPTDIDTLCEKAYTCSGVGITMASELLDSIDANRYMIPFGQSVIDMHAKKPIELLVGDDISGRTPTLIARKLLQQSHAAGLTENAPPTVFMSSGILHFISDNPDAFEEERWQNNLTDWAWSIYAKYQPTNALIVTDTKASGDSIYRIKMALYNTGISISSINELIAAYEFYLKKKPVDKQAVGLEKRGISPTTFRRPDFDGDKAAKLRAFIDEYSKYLFKIVADQRQEEAASRWL